MPHHISNLPADKTTTLLLCLCTKKSNSKTTANATTWEAVKYNAARCAISPRVKMASASTPRSRNGAPMEGSADPSDRPLDCAQDYRVVEIGRFSCVCDVHGNTNTVSTRLPPLNPERPTRVQDGVEPRLLGLGTSASRTPLNPENSKKGRFDNAIERTSPTTCTHADTNLLQRH
ncbi:hypothetical protein HBH88_020770 [Parastagonospora nodorum]|nr:hypothetical protein HBH49_137660 [Parastagonospora nodorum]KAH4337248.1 hypothetical protein HBI00_019420 [Parastagonospora nodorum]KAH4515809.1 hypothetical protein HBH88_020770 [Parastagonospora nodorum]KAH6154970.1 hypothetical protein HBI63_101040 [Parastagonospora nodorum]